MKRYIRASRNPYPASKIEDGLMWDNNGHQFDIMECDDFSDICTVRETWIAEDTGKEMIQKSKWKIEMDQNGDEYVHPIGNPNYKLYAGAAFNYYLLEDLEDPEEDEFYEEDYYTGSGRNYSPSAPWNAPGMSIHDFI